MKEGIEKRIEPVDYSLADTPREAVALEIMQRWPPLCMRPEAKRKKANVPLEQLGLTPTKE
jgi:hypothetical protein